MEVGGTLRDDLPPHDPASDMVQLMDRIRRGDGIAVHEFYVQVEPFLRSLARRLLNPGLRRQVDSLDVAESAFRRVLEGGMRARFENETKVLAWLATIVRNRIRTLSRRVTGPGGGTYLPLLDEAPLAGTSRDPSAWAGDVEEVQRFREAMEGLPEAEREVIALHDFEEMTFAEIASLTGRTSAEAARKLHDRALARLRKHLAKSTS
jgi:RNA polymerase sigma factor (sigma-70 family)